MMRKRKKKKTKEERAGHDEIGKNNQSEQFKYGQILKNTQKINQKGIK